MQKSSYRHSRLRERRRKRKTLFIIAGVLIFSVAVTFIARAPYFSIQTIEISGAHAVLPILVKTVAEKELGGSFIYIFPKNSILWLPKKEIAQKVRENSETIKNVTVSLAFPKKVNIHIEEYIPEAFICGSREELTNVSLPKNFLPECFLLDAGFSFATTSAKNIATTNKLLQIKKKEVSKIELKKQVISPKQFLYTTLLFQKLSQNNISIDYIVLETDGDYTAHTEGGAELYFSESLPLTDAIKNMATLLGSEIFKKEELLPPEGFKKIEYIDLRFGNKLYYKIKSNNAPQTHETNS